VQGAVDRGCGDGGIGERRLEVGAVVVGQSPEEECDGTAGSGSGGFGFDVVQEAHAAFPARWSSMLMNVRDNLRAA